MPDLHCTACGQQISDPASTCPHCGQPAASTGDGVGRKRGVPVWGKILLLLLPGMVVVGFLAATKPSEAELRQAIRDKGKELQARAATAPAILIDVPHFADRFTFHDHFISSEIKFTTDRGDVIRVAVGQVGNITVSETW